MSSPRKLTFIEVARVLGILAVVLIHTFEQTVPQAQTTAIYQFISPLIRFVVPLFFIISGFVLGIHHRDPVYRVEFRSFWRRRLTTLVIPFFAWNVIYMLILEVANGQSIADVQTLLSLLTGYMHLYYVFVLLQFLLLYSLLGNHLNARVLLVCLILAAASSIAFYALSGSLLWTLGPDDHQFEWRWGKLFVGWAVFFFWGLWLGYTPAALDRLKRRQGWLLLGTAAAYGLYLVVMRYQYVSFETYARDYFLLAGLPFQLLAATWLLALLYGADARLQASPFWRRVAGWGPDTFGIYVAHMAFLIGIVALWQAFLPAAPAGLAVLIVAALTLLVTEAFLRLCLTPRLRLLGLILFGARGASGDRGRA
jgi:surface polysaccharide O-acyltransferase-like enzyme